MRKFNPEIQTIAAWLGPRGQSFDLLRIFTLNAINGFFFLYFGSFEVVNGIYHYHMWVESMVTGDSIKGIDAMYIRDIGMPLILLISGYPFNHSLIGVAIIQFLMGMAMPPLAYLALRPWFPKAAYYAAIGLAISLSPFLLAKTIHHDQPYIFFTVLNLYLINLYVWKKRPAALYGMTLGVFAMSLIRQTGKGLYPLLVFIALLEGNKINLKYVVTGVLIFIACAFSYTKYREHVLGDLPAVGKESFENVYLNSSEFGIRLSPDFGPNVKYIIDSVRECLLPSPTQSEFLRKNAPSPPDFMAQNYYKYSTDELMERILTRTNFSYFMFLQGCVEQRPGSDKITVSDKIYLKASLETAAARPGLVLAYTLRNAFQLLYDPGWMHGRDTMEPHFRSGRGFPFGGATRAGEDNIGEKNIPKPALSEAAFIPLARQPKFIQEFYFFIEKTWSKLYHPLTILAGCFGLFTWISTAIGLLTKIVRTPMLARWSRLWLSDQVVPATLGASALLLGNVFVTALFIDSYYRYDFSLIILKIVLAAVGCAIVINLVKAAFPTKLLKVGRRPAP